ncbi:pentatricopeptide repeat-containing protein [Tanacetum coccineum]
MEKRLCFVDDLKMLKITMLNASSRNKLYPEINDHYNIFTGESQEYELKTKDEAGCKANTITQNILLNGLVKSNMNGYGKTSDVETAYELFNRMVKEGIRPDLKSYKILVECLCLVARVDDATYYFDQMKETGLDLDVISYNLMINGHGTVRRIEDALELFDEMQRGISPNLYTHNLWSDPLVEVFVCELAEVRILPWA